MSESSQARIDALLVEFIASQRRCTEYEEANGWGRWVDPTWKNPRPWSGRWKSEADYLAHRAREDRQLAWARERYGRTIVGFGPGCEYYI